MATVLEAKTKFQKIRIDQDFWRKGEVVLYLDEAWQLNTGLEHKYHEALMTVPMAAAPSIDRVLICGGGDGMALREAIRFPDCSRATLVEIDPGMIQVWRDMPEYAKYNQNSMRHEKARVVVEDAVGFAKRSDAESFDFIALDFPSPSSANADKDYNNLFAPAVIDEFLRLLPSHGTLSVQVSVTTEVLARLVVHLLKRGLSVWQYDSYYTKQSHDSFLVASRHRLEYARPIPEGARFATARRVGLAFSHVTELSWDQVEYFNLFCDAHEIEREDV
jgi:predicted membrane-bound spermidine synthase